MPKKQFEGSHKEQSLFDVLRLGESYTSLILGIVVVIVSTVLLLSFVHNKNKGVTPEQKTNVVQVTPTAVVSPSAKPEVTKVAKEAKKATPAVKAKAPTVAPTKVAKKASPTVVPTKAAKPSPTPKVEVKGTYKVATGDTLWLIAEKNYKSGYNWVDIARANNLSNPDHIKAGDKLVLPKVKSKVATVATPTPTKKVAKATPTVAPTKAVAKKVTPTPTVVKQPEMKKITASTYTVAKGDNLWNISVRSYGDGYQWVKLAKVNKLANPDIIHPGNKLTIPRK